MTPLLTFGKRCLTPTIREAQKLSLRAAAAATKTKQVFITFQEKQKPTSSPPKPKIEITIKPKAADRDFIVGCTYVQHQGVPFAHHQYPHLPPCHIHPF